MSPAKHPPVALLTDFGEESYYPSVMKGVIAGLCPDASVVDVSHHVRPFAVTEASYILARVFEFFPTGAVFVAVVDPGVGGERKDLVVSSGGRYVVTPDNGIISDIVIEYGVDSCHVIRKTSLEKIRRHRAIGRTFLGRDVFAPAAAALARGDSPEQLGEETEDYSVVDLPVVQTRQRSVVGWSRYIDPFGNILTNISAGHIRKAFGQIPLAAIHVVIDTRKVEGIFEYFSQGKTGELMAILNAWDRLEISCNRGRAIDFFPGAQSLQIRLEPF